MNDKVEIDFQLMALFQNCLSFLTSQANIYVDECCYQLCLVPCICWNMPPEPLLLGRIFVAFYLSCAINKRSKDEEDFRGRKKYEQNISHMTQQLYTFDRQFLAHVHQNEVKFLDAKFAQIFIMQLLAHDGQPTGHLNEFLASRPLGGLIFEKAFCRINLKHLLYNFPLLRIRYSISETFFIFLY